MSQGYRHQHTPAALQKLNICFLTRADINAGWARLRESHNPLTSYEYAHNQALGSCYTANSILISLTKSQRFDDEESVLPDGYSIDGSPLLGTRPIIVVDDQLDPYARLGDYGRHLPKGMNLVRLMRDFEQDSLPGESVTDFFRRKYQQKGNSDV